MGKIRRKHSKIDKLPSTLKGTVEQMMQGDFTYKEIAEFIKQKGYPISTQAVYRHANTLNATVQSLRIAQDNFRVLMDVVSESPDVDATEGLTRLMSANVLEAINNLDGESLKELDPLKLMKAGSDLVKATAYKKNIAHKNKDMREAGLDEIKTLFFESMAKEDPELYSRVVKFLNGLGGAEGL